MEDFITKIAYTSPDGANIIFFNDGSGYFIEEGGASGLSGDTEDIILELPDGGQYFTGMNIKPMKCDLKIVAFGDDYEEQAQERMVFLTSLFSRRKPGTLILINTDGDTYSLPIRLEKQIEVPDKETALDDTIQRTFPIVCDRGYWTKPLIPSEIKKEDGYYYEIINNGDLPTNALIHWEHKTGSTPPEIKIDDYPSIQLPEPTNKQNKKYILDLDPRSSMAIIDEEENLYIDMWKKVRKNFLKTDILPGEKQTIKSNVPIKITYDIRVLNPWRW